MSRESRKKARDVRLGAPPLAPQTAGLKDRWAVPGICLFLVAIIWVVFGQTWHDEFVNFDDNFYVYDNPEVAHGLTLKGIIWAFTHFHSYNWHPLTWISHMLDCQFYGLNAGGHHVTSVLLHTAAAILLFLVLRQMTGYLWRSAFVAAVFAVHPLHVESVAWISERKDVLSGVFFMLTLGAYAHYARRPWSPARYGLVVLLFALGLMSKPMLVTVPLVLMLLDYWPLNRLRADSATQPVLRLGNWLVPKRLVLEKLPLLGLAAASCVVTYFAQTEAITSFVQISLPLRAGNALVSYVTYMSQMFWPSGLAVYYPLTANGVSPSEVISASILLLSISTAVFILRKGHPHLLVGWLWYLIMLIPVIGILQVGSQAHADRYTYLPQIGLYLILVWGVADLCATWRHRRLVLGSLSAVLLAAMIFCARTQASYWRNSESLWTHALACTSENAFAHNNLGFVLFQNGDINDAITHYQEALQINPNMKEALNNLGNVMLQKGDLDGAIVYYQQALQINPDYAEANNNLGYALFQKGDVDEAIRHYQLALQINPDFLEANYNLANALLRKGNANEAIACYQRALQINPGYLQALNNLALVLATAPQASLRNGTQAVELAAKANQLTGGKDLFVLHTLAAAYAEAGRFEDAIGCARKALELSQAAGQQAMVEQLNSELKLYEAGLPFHQP